MYISSSATTTITTGGTYYKLNGTTTIGNAADFDMPANNRLRYTGTETQKFLVGVSSSATTDDPNRWHRLRLAINGTTLADTTITWFPQDDQEEYVGSIDAIVELNQNNYIELWASTERDGKIIELKNMLFTISSMGGGTGEAGPQGTPGASGVPGTDGQTIKGISVDALGMYPSTTNGCDTPQKIEFGTNDVDKYICAFDQDNDEYAQFSVRMPPEWDGGTVTAKFHWTAASGAGNVMWSLHGISYGDSDPLDTAWGTVQSVTDTLITTNDEHITSATPAITLAGTPAGGERAHFRVYRDAADVADTLTADAWLLAAYINFSVT
jgi:hypothetical protein